MSQTAFSAREFQRYARHLQLPQVGVAGQLKLKQAHVLVVGCGGLGAPVSQYLAAAGVGTITLLDGDTVDLSNLQRQVIFSEADLGLPKAECAQRRLQALNSCIELRAVTEQLTTDNAVELISGCQIVADCTDNFAARYLINDVCKQQQRPWVYASIHQFSGQLAFFTPQGPCFRCLFPKPPLDVPDCNAAGVIGVLPGILGTLQAAEILKYLLDLPGVLANKLMMVETTDMLFQQLGMRQSEDCELCQGEQQFDADSEFYQPVCASDVDDSYGVSAEVFERQRQNDGLRLIDVRSADEHQAYNLGGENVPLEQLPDWLALQETGTDFVFYCQSGVRSLAACEAAAKQGIKAYNLQGGVLGYLQSSQR